MNDPLDEDADLRGALAGCDPSWLADLERQLNGTQADMDRARPTAMSDPRYAPLDELLHLANSSRVNRLRQLRSIKDVTR